MSKPVPHTLEVMLEIAAHKFIEESNTQKDKFNKGYFDGKAEACTAFLAALQEDTPDKQVAKFKELCCNS